MVVRRDRAALQRRQGGEEVGFLVMFLGEGEALGLGIALQCDNNLSGLEIGIPVNGIAKNFSLHGFLPPIFR